MNRLKASALIMALALAPAAAHAADTPEAAFERYRAEINTHDFERLARDVVAQDAVFVFAEKVHRGVDAARAAFNETWKTLPDEVYSMSEAEWLAKDTKTAVVAFRYGYKGVLTDGRSLEGGGRGMNVYRLTDAGWRLTYEHLSPDAKATKVGSKPPAT